MKCLKCGETIEGTDKFCANCGEKVKRKGNGFSINNIIIIIVLCVCLIGILFGINRIVNYFTSPNYVAMKYFEVVANNDVDKIYSYIEKYEDSPFVSKEILNDKMTRLENIENYSIKSIKTENNKTYVELQYDLGGEYKTSYVEVKRVNNSKFLKTYEVVSGKLAQNVTIRVLKNAKVTVDGKDISAYLNENDNDEYYDTYVMPAMIQGSYKFLLTLENGLIMEKNISLQSDSTYTLSKINLDTEVTTSLEKTIKESLNTLYKSAIQEKNYEDISSNFKNDLSSLYRSIKRSIKSSSKVMKEINFTDVEIKSSMFNDKGNLEVDIFADYDMKYSYQGEEKQTEVSNYMSLSVELDSNFEFLNIYTSYQERERIYE